MPRTSIATDNFNRAGPAIGSNWAVLTTATLLINASIQATGEFSNASAGRWVGAGSFTDDQYSSVTLVNAASGFGATYWGGVIVRASADTGAGRDYYMAYKVHSGGSNATVLAKCINGTETVIHSAVPSPDFANGDVLSLEVEGTTLRVCRNGTPLGGSWTATDTDLSSGLPGIIVSDPVFIDDWEGGNITVGGNPARNLSLLGVG